MADLCMPKCLRVATDPRKKFLVYYVIVFVAKLVIFSTCFADRICPKKQTTLAINMPLNGNIPYVHVVNAKNI